MTAAEFTTDGRKWVNMNGSHGNHYAHQGLMNEWKSLAVSAVRKARVQPVPTPVVITVSVHRTTNAHSDAHNVAPTWKACVDAAVECGVIPDDHDGYVSAMVIKRGPNRKVPAITLRIESLAAPVDLGGAA